MREGLDDHVHALDHFAGVNVEMALVDDGVRVDSEVAPSACLPQQGYASR